MLSSIADVGNIVLMFLSITRLQVDLIDAWFPNVTFFSKGLLDALLASASISFVARGRLTIVGQGNGSNTASMIPCS